MHQISILLADDHNVVRQGLRNIIETQKRMQVVGEATDGREAVDLTAKLRPDVIIMDINMPNLNGIDATRQIVKNYPETRVLTLSIHKDPHYVSSMIEAGCSGYLVKDCYAQELIQAIQTIHSGNRYISPGISDLLYDDYQRKLQQREHFHSAKLTDREREVLQLIAEGDSSKIIAQKLHVSIKTINTHRTHILKKLKTTNQADLIKYALREGLTSLDF